ncbi:30S ribosomal protein S7 [Candidatus Woesearchaeota archaeon]|nr:30S ribosomal protein S7 [Candidatus Woesearchaeota archaeon]
MDILVFDKWSAKDLAVEDPGLQRYITLDPAYRSKTGARYGGRRFYKSKIFIVERLINKLMVPGHRGKKHKITSGHVTGKAANARRIVEEAFELVEKRTKKNPVEVFVKALENGAPREEILTIEYGGARYPKAVDVAPQRRVDYVLRLLVHGSFDRSFNKKKSMAQALADEIVAAYSMSADSTAISKKNDVERQADSSR